MCQSTHASRHSGGSEASHHVIFVFRASFNVARLRACTCILSSTALITYFLSWLCFSHGVRQRPPGNNAPGRGAVGRSFRHPLLGESFRTIETQIICSHTSSLGFGDTELNASMNKEGVGCMDFVCRCKKDEFRRMRHRSRVEVLSRHQKASKSPGSLTPRPAGVKLLNVAVLVRETTRP